MAGLHKQPARTVVSLHPLRGTDNQFIGAFSQAISLHGYSVREFRWSSLGLRKTDFVFLHWPDDFFTVRGKIGIGRSLIKLAAIQIAKVLWGAKLIWIAHNAKPHDVGRFNTLSWPWFLRMLDGVIFLSDYSRQVIGELYPEISKLKTLLVAHGHYRGVAVTREKPYAAPQGDIQLVQFGRIRPYKNTDALVDAVSSLPSGTRLMVAGMANDRSLRAAIEERASRASHITLDFRESPISDEELEGIVDSADAVVLPYKNILNSGSALFSLSRNRPVLAPNMGALPELRAAVGHEWVYLYDGEFCSQVLVDFREWMLKTKRDQNAPLDAYGWDGIGMKLRDFIETMGA